MGVEDALDLVGWGQYAGAVKMRPTACAAYVRTDIVTHSLCADQQVEYRCLKDCLVTAAVMCWLDGNRVQWSEDVIKADPFFGRSRVRFRVPPWVSNTIARDHLA